MGKDYADRSAIPAPHIGVSYTGAGRLLAVDGIVEFVGD